MKTLRFLILTIALSVLGLKACLAEEPPQKALEQIDFVNEMPAFSLGQGPAIAVHRSVSPYTIRGSFNPFLQLARTDGFKVDYLDGPITASILADLKLLVIPNAYTKNYNDFDTLSAPSTYTDDEISLINNWVKEGGNLLILADHSPFAGGTIKLASSFGFVYMTGHAINKASLSSLIKVRIDFKKSERLLADHPITNGATGRKPISHFFAFGGQAIIPPKDALSLLTIPDYFETLLGFSPSREFDTAPRMDSGGLSQGAVMNYGNGRLMIMGETGGFTAQIILNSNRIGFEEPLADENKEFILSALRWLVGFTPN